MNGAIAHIIQQQMQHTAEQLRRNQMQPYCVDTAQQVRTLIQELIPAGATVGMGGSVTLAECGIPDLLRNGPYHFLDREGLSSDALQQHYRDCFRADYYLCSANAITRQGEIFNVDGRGNRVAALAFGPQHIIIVAGSNKLTADLQQAEHRLRTIAAPANVKRLNCNAPCMQTGECVNCKSASRICCTYTVQRFSSIPNRIKVILVTQPLGF